MGIELGELDSADLLTGLVTKTDLQTLIGALLVISQDLAAEVADVNAVSRIEVYRRLSESYVMED